MQAKPESPRGFPSQCNVHDFNCAAQGFQLFLGMQILLLRPAPDLETTPAVPKSVVKDEAILRQLFCYTSCLCLCHAVSLGSTQALNSPWLKMSEM